MRRRGCATVARIADNAGTRDGSDGALAYAAYPVIVGVRDEQSATCINRNRSRCIEKSCTRGAAITAEPGHAGAGDRSDDTGGGNLADNVIVNVGEEEVTGGVIGQT